MHQPVISGTGVFTPSDTITNAELVEAFNAYAEAFNKEHADAIAAGEMEAKAGSSVEFIFKASGIEQRYVMDKKGVLDPAIMHPVLRERVDDEPGIMAEMALDACQKALAQAGVDASEVDLVICAASNHERAYPAIAVEIQKLLGAGGFAFDMNVACSSATFGIETARGLIAGGQAKSVLVVNPEICSAHLNFKDRDSHFIFGDVATAILIDDESLAPNDGWDIVGSKLVTKFSNNIRNNFGFLNRCAPEDDGLNAKGLSNKLFVQNGRSVFKEVVPMVAAMIKDELDGMDIRPKQIKRMWLHQANLSMNVLIAKKVMGKDVEIEQAPVVLDEYANTSSAGSIIAFHKHSSDFKSGDLGLICSFGAGYSAGLIVVKKR